MGRSYPYVEVQLTYSLAKLIGLKMRVYIYLCTHIFSLYFFLWFELVSLFNGISTLCGLFNAKGILEEEPRLYYLRDSLEDKGVHYLSQAQK